eukprot:70689_1
MADTKQNDVDEGDTSNISTTLGIIGEAYLFKIPPKASAMGHMADTWPKKAMWLGRLKILSTATQCTLQFEDVDTDKVYLKVLVNNDKDKVSTIEPTADSSRYFALNITKPGTDQIFELGLGFQGRDESMDFKMAVGEFERMKQNLEESKIFNMKAKEDFSLGADEVLVMKPMANKKKREETKDNDDEFDGFLPPPSSGNDSKSKKKKSKKKKKKKKSAKPTEKNEDNAGGDLFGDFTQADANDDGGWASFD